MKNDLFLKHKFSTKNIFIGIKFIKCKSSNSRFKYFNIKKEKYIQELLIRSYNICFYHRYCCYCQKNLIILI